MPLHLEYRYISGRETQGLYATLLARPEWPLYAAGTLGGGFAPASCNTAMPNRVRPTTEETMKAVHESQGRAACGADWSQRVARFIAALGVVVAVAPMSFAQ